MAKKMDVITLVQKHGENIPKIQKLLGQKEKLEDQATTVQKRLKQLDSQLGRLLSATSTAPKRKKKKVVKKKKRGNVGRPPKIKKKVGRPKVKKRAGRTAGPNPGTTPYMMAQVMSSTKPMKPADIVDALQGAGYKAKPGTVKFNLPHQPYFKNIKGEGYTYSGPAVPGLKKKTRKKAVKRTARKKARRNAVVPQTVPSDETTAT